MFVRDAKAKCPDLEIVPYNFAAYEQVRNSVMHYKCSNDFHHLFWALASGVSEISQSFVYLDPFYLLQNNMTVEAVT
jgi:hypothetical protein